MPIRVRVTIRKGTPRALLFVATIGEDSLMYVMWIYYNSINKIIKGFRRNKKNLVSTAQNLEISSIRF